MKASEYARWLIEQADLKRPYWYGTCGYECTESLLKKKEKQYPSHYTKARMPRYEADIRAHQICADCVGGAIKWPAWSDLGRHANIYQSDGCPDASADGMFDFCRDKGMAWGGMDSLPELPGIAVRRSGHVGVYVGGGKAVEWRGFRYGCVMTNVKDRGWTQWYKLPWVDYGTGEAGEAAAKPKPTQSTLGDRQLEKGDRGADVRALQEALNRLGFDAGKADGVYGSRTAAAVRRMQKAVGIVADGIYGVRSHKALMSLWAQHENGEDVPDEPAAANGKIRITGGHVNVRSGAGTQYEILTVVSRGAELPYAGESENGWYAVRLSDRIGWVSGKYAKREA